MIKNDLAIVLCGEAGQGIQTVENILVKIIKQSGYHVFATKEYMSRVRGGVNSTSLRIASTPVAAYIDRIDIFFQLGKELTKHLQKRISSETIVISDLPNNISAVGTVVRLLNIELKIAEQQIKERFSVKGETVVNDNLKALAAGYAYGDKIKIDLNLRSDPSVAQQMIISGAEAIGLGAIAGGCNFIAAYPMTPSTGIFTFLSQQAKEFGIISEQAEDEISAMNMALGAWYAGARALVNTSGGGYDLMQEGLSLAGMLELPLVINLAQRPGPATGLPTRTEQADLNLALYSGHGEFPRIILAPGSLEEAFSLTQKAFNLADKYQVPVFILSDQYLNDSYYNLPQFDLSKIKNEVSIVKTDKDYKRYALTESGLSPRGIPGNGGGLVALDSDEHDEMGHITEDLIDLRTKMVEKKLKKLAGFKVDEILPELCGDKNYSTLMISWGSTRNIIKEAVEKSGKKEVACLHFRQVYPLPSNTVELLKKAKKRIVIEGNAAGQFANLIKLITGIECEQKVLKYNGLPFSVEEVLQYV